MINLSLTIRKNSNLTDYYINEISKIIELSKTRSSSSNNKEIFEQFFTDPSTAIFMARLFKEKRKKHIHILDPGAGVGVLGVAVITQICTWDNKPEKITLTCYEIDESLLPYLEQSLSLCEEICLQHAIKFTSNIETGDFVSKAINTLHSKIKNTHDFSILNPPYKKINNDSECKQLLSDIGVDVTNEYTAFVALVKRLLNRSGELVAITPRSFCNGQYFYQFRKDFLSEMVIDHIHLFESRSKVFTGENVLQENVIYHATKKKKTSKQNVTISFSEDQNLNNIEQNSINYEQLIHPEDESLIIRLLKNGDDEEIKNKVESLPSTLDDLNLLLSTGPVVDFREKQSDLSKDVTIGSVPLIYPEHFNNGFITWPKPDVRKYNSIYPADHNLSRLRPIGNYVLVKRMSSKEERRRIVAAVYNSNDYNMNLIGFENKINYFHRNGEGFDLLVAKGLSLYLNSTQIDTYFRQFSGNTQVNASDLKRIKYPSLQKLSVLGNAYGTTLPIQTEIDRLVEQICF